MEVLVKKILREESDKSLSNERLQKLVGDYITTSYPTAIKVRVAPPGGNIELTLLTLPNPEDERDFVANVTKLILPMTNFYKQEMDKSNNTSDETFNLFIRSDIKLCKWWLENYRES